MSAEGAPAADRRHAIGPTDAFPPGSSTVMEIGGRSIGIFNDGGRLHAIRNVCPHHGAPLCRGGVSGTMLPAGPHEYVYSGDAAEHRVVRCPWHGYEFRIADGVSIADPARMRVRAYRVEIEAGEVVVYL
jgi:nitrite reductase (NADH) small subunit